MGASLPDLHRTALSDAEFDTLRHLIHDAAGISLSKAKRQLLKSRLTRRLIATGCQSFGEYADFLKRNRSSGEEWQEMINCITTNKTDFFRESHHFEFLRDVCIPQWVARKARKVSVWSAACSTGQEPYSIAMTLLEHLAPYRIDFEVLATDIDTQVLEEAQAGIYSQLDLDPVPTSIARKCFLRGIGASVGHVRVRQELQKHVQFQQINLNGPSWAIPKKFDAIFCRNVVIYFDRITQQRLFNRLADRLPGDGFLFIGHSENLNGVCDRFTPIGRTVYRLATRSQGSTTQVVAPDEISIAAGELFVSRDPVLVRTVVRCSLAVCLCDPVAQVGGMTHLPELIRTTTTPLRSQTVARNMLEEMMSRLQRLGASRSRLRAKLFGGESHSRETSGHHHPECLVTECLQEVGIPIDTQVPGPGSNLTIRYQAHTGRAWVKSMCHTLGDKRPSVRNSS